MEQKSDVEFRAEKTYKSTREKFGYLLREVVSNAIHATIIRKRKERESNYKPKISITIDLNDTRVSITLKDNGDGFNDLNRRYFTHLDMKNPEKEDLNLHPKGQGRLAIIFFADSATYSSVYIDPEHKCRYKTFNYPEAEHLLSLFDIEEEAGTTTDRDDVGTTLSLNISKQQTFGRAKTFFNRYDDLDKLRNWFIENFFPFFMEVEHLRLEVTYNGAPGTVDREYIEKSVTSIPFPAKLGQQEPKDEPFTIWLAEKAEPAKPKNQITCFARHLRADIAENRLEYEIDLPRSYDWLLTSTFFDENVDPKGDKIEITTEDVTVIQQALNDALDEHFAKEIAENQKQTRCNIDSAKSKYHSLSVFVDASKVEGRKCILKEQDIVGAAIESKGKIEKSYWTSQETDDEDIARLLNSSLQIYVDHRGRVLNRFKELVEKFDQEGEVKREIEDSIHDLLMKRGQNLRESKQINHLHNLWILDDKFTIFSDTFHGKSTRSGQGLSDIYFWIDDPSPKRTKEMLILELKSTSSAHNAGDKYESMVAQVKRYASQFYRDPVKILNWNIDPDKILYSAVILARKSDVYKELASNNVSGNPKKIPFLESSYYFNESFSIQANGASAPRFMDIRIDMYSYEDIHALALSRNEVYLNLLNNEFGLEADKQGCPQMTENEQPRKGN